MWLTQLVLPSLAIVGTAISGPIPGQATSVNTKTIKNDILAVGAAIMDTIHTVTFYTQGPVYNSSIPHCFDNIHSKYMRAGYHVRHLSTPLSGSESHGTAELMKATSMLQLAIPSLVSELERKKPEFNGSTDVEDVVKMLMFLLGDHEDFIEFLQGVLPTAEKEITAHATKATREAVIEGIAVFAMNAAP